MSDKLEKHEFALGMEIRDKVTNFVGEKIRALILNTNYEKFTNLGVIRTNCMKLMLNYFYKGQIDKLFLCFADPHFKKYTHRRRIVK
jgi:tRNA (guanine-N7-)-methyltransferase